MSINDQTDANLHLCVYLQVLSKLLLCLAANTTKKSIQSKLQHELHTGSSNYCFGAVENYLLVVLAKA